MKSFTYRSLRSSGRRWIATGDFFPLCLLIRTTTLIGVFLLLFELVAAQSSFDEYQKRAEALSAEADQLRLEWNAVSFEKALKKYTAARLLWHELGLWQEEARAFQDCGDIYSLTGRYQAALDSLTAGQRIYQLRKDWLNESNALRMIADIYVAMGRYREALVYCDRALQLNESRDLRVKAGVLNTVADASHFLSDNNRTRAALQEVIPIWETMNDKAGLARALNRKASVLGDEGEVLQALEIRNRALSLCQEANDRQCEALTLTSIGTQLTFIGEYERSLQAHRQSLSISQTMGDRRSEALAIGSMGYTYFTLGDFDKALMHYERSATLFKEISNPYEEATMVANIGDVYSVNGSNDKALEKYRTALSTVRAFQDRLWEALILYAMGAAYFDTGDTQRALDSFSQALTLFNDLHNQRWEATSLVGLGNVALKLKNVSLARDYLGRALVLTRNAYDAGGEAVVHYNIARLERDFGDLAQSRLEIETALKINETLRSKVSSHQSRTSYLASVHQYYEFYIDVLMHSAHQQPSKDFVARGFEASEQGRARTLVEMLVESSSEIRTGADRSLLAREQSLEQQLAAQDLSEMRLLPETKQTREKAEAIRLEKLRLTTEYESVQSQIRASSPGYSKVQPTPITVSAIQQLLDDDTVLLEYSLGDERSFLWAVTPGSISSVELPARSAIEAAARRVYALLTARNQQVNNESSTQAFSRVSESDEAYYGAAKQLSQMLLGRLGDALKCKRLVIIGDGALQYIPFAALPSPETPNVNLIRETLNDRYQIINLPSAAVLAVLRRKEVERQSPKQAIAVFADPVFDRSDVRVISRRGSRNRPPVQSKPIESSLGRSLRDVGLNPALNIPRLVFSRQEAEAIFGSSPRSQALKILDFNASRRTLANTDLSQFKIIHFATHSLLNSEHPEMSGILLSMVDEQGAAQNGFIQLTDIYRLNMPVELVVLSACQTALGKDIRGEGLVGLTRGFMYAGAARVVASLWKVDDAATAALMAQFYKEMFQNGKRPAEALRAAQIYISQQPRWRSPYFWSAFVLQGEWR